MSVSPIFGREDARASVSASHWAVPVLIVDDDPAKRLALRAVLAPLGYNIVEAESGAASLRCLMATEFAVILLDVRMPGMDGFETASLIRLRRESEMTPIIFVTAHDTDEVTTDRYAEGAVDFITMPVHPEELRAKVSVFANLFLQARANAAKAREVQSSADQLRLLTETAPIGIFQTDAHNRYVYTNARWSEITGISGDEVSGEPWHRFIGDHQRANLAADLLATPDSNEFSSRLEMNLPGADPQILMLTSKALFDEDGGISGWVGTLADITAEAGAEAAMATARDEATAASRLKSDFLANMSHEIRTPMNGVIGLTELLLETDLDAQQRKFLESLSKSGEALMTVINGILDFAKIERGKLEIDEIEFDLQTLLDEVVDLLAPSAQTKGLSLTTVLDASVPASVSGDPGRLRQVLTNLTSNAVKFTHEGEIVIRVTAVETDGDQTLVRFELSDTGVGIAEDKQAMIFEPFTQADTSTTREYGGTGLGLAISSQLVKLMGGELGITSQLGAGSTFWFTVSVHALAHEDTDEHDVADADLIGERALIVDDNTTRCSIVSGYLRRWGMRVETAPSGAAALEKMRSAAEEGQPIAVALVETSLRRLEAVALGRSIRAEPVPAVSLVLMTEPEERDGLADLGEGLCLAKPVRREELRTCLLQTLAGGTASPPTAAPAEGESGRVLLAEDNAVNQMAAVAILSQAGYHVDTVRNGAEAVRAAAAGVPYDAILMDCQMPQLDGYEATAAIRESEGLTRRTPIIALTAGAADEDRCAELGLDSHLPKPLHKATLLAMLRQSLPTAG